jgi:hypothetical protein
MAARLNPRHSEMVRQKIQASCLVDRLHKIAMGEVEATAQQITASIALLDRSVPKLSQIQHVGDSENPVKVEFSWKQN